MQRKNIFLQRGQFYNEDTVIKILKESQDQKISSFKPWYEIECNTVDAECLLIESA